LACWVFFWGKAVTGQNCRKGKSKTSSKKYEPLKGLGKRGSGIKNEREKKEN